MPACKRRAAVAEPQVGLEIKRFNIMVRSPEFLNCEVNREITQEGKTIKAARTKERIGADQHTWYAKPAS